MTVIDIAELPVAEKLKLMEALWDSLSAGTEGELRSPGWHETELERRLHRLEAGEETVASWPEAKERIRAQTRDG